MGIDLRLRGLAAEANLDAIKVVLSEHDQYADVSVGVSQHGWVSDDPGGKYLFIDPLHLWFDDTYDRGNWPKIRAILVALRPIVPQLEYGPGYANFYGEYVCDAMIARLDAVWEKSLNEQAAER